jgi:antirestriction protein ArdC
MAYNPYAEVTARILAELETGAAPWVKPWSVTAGRNMPMNATTGNAYQGANVVLLWMATHSRFKQPHFLTYNQAKQAGGHVREGEKSCATICKVLQGVAKPKDGETEGRAFSSMKFYAVFNVEQCDGLPADLVSIEPRKPNNNDERDATIEEFIAATGADYSETGGDKAFYSPGFDCVKMPAFDHFKSAAAYYSTAFHELGHWTGAEKRCNRTFGKRFGDRAYAAEELVAELTAAFLCAEFSIDGQLRHAGYIDNWIALLKDDAKAFFTAASAAQKAADFLRSRALADEMPIAA